MKVEAGKKYFWKTGDIDVEYSWIIPRSFDGSRWLVDSAFGPISYLPESIALHFTKETKLLEALYPEIEDG